MSVKQPAFQILAALLHYPNQALLAALETVRAAVAAETLFQPDEAAAIDAFASALSKADLIDSQARYVDTFDRGRARSLYLFEHVYGESRDRGQAMVELTRIYRQHGLEIAARELPDYLPLYLEFLALLPPAQAVPRLAEIAPLVAHLYAQLTKHNSAYAVLLQPLLRLSGVLANDAGVHAQVAAQAPDDTPAALDAAWIEAPVTFAPATGCGGSGGAASEHTIQWHDRRSTDRPGGGTGGK
ncbi:MAG: nitrate reductase molybdenum cofactor assembly chaperone [Gammaproteobacteria bacterium]|nr:nitrate reductase molybdenum cofactor assembly chaperone [Gammaproteobacteria bacterium]